MVTTVQLIQDVQLACFVIIFTFMVISNRRDRMLRLVWYSFLVAGLAAIVNLFAPSLPHWIGYGFNYISPSLSYGLLGFAFALFLRRELWTRWIPVALIAGSLPFYLYWSNNPSHVNSIGVVDFVLFVQAAVIAWLLTRGHHRSTRVSRLTMSAFFAIGAAVELYRAAVVAFLHADPDAIHPATQLVSIVSTSVLPLAILWMLNARMHHEIIAQSVIDPLTGVLNRHGLVDVARREFARYARGRQEFAVAVANIDHFKLVNKNHGHATGDEVLRSAASVFSTSLRYSDLVSRTDGDEFIMLLPMTSEEEATAIVDRLRAALEQHITHFHGKDVQITVSVGIANTHGRNHLTWNALEHEASIALFSAKLAGRNRCVHFHQLPEGEIAIRDTMIDPTSDADVILPTA
jgi:diguanylate cyclase (GGDEF)-like protein